MTARPDRPEAPDGGPAAPADRERALYVGACRIDLVRRSGTSRLLADRHIALTVARALEASGAPTPASVTIVLTDDAELRDLNRAHLAVDEPTDVLSFPMLEPGAFPAGRRAEVAGVDPSGGPPATVPTMVSMPDRRRGERVHVGDIAISVERAIEQAEAGRGGQTGDVRWAPADELRLLVTHGVLHLCGWDHADPTDERAMRALEQRLLAEDRR